MVLIMSKRSIFCLVLAVSLAYCFPVEPATELAPVESLVTDSATSETPPSETPESTSTDSTTVSTGAELSASDEPGTVSNNLEASSTPQSEPDSKKNDEVLETVRFPQNRIPLRLLQRNRWLPKRTTIEPESQVTDSTSTQQPESYRVKPVANMIMEKSRAATFFQENSGNQSPQLPPVDDSRSDSISSPVDESQSVASPSRSVGQPPVERSQYDFRRIQPINRHFQSQFQQGPLQPLNPPPFDSAPRVNSLNDMLKAFPSDRLSPTTQSSVINGNISTPLPLPVPLNKVPFHLRPNQEIQNRLLEAEWIRRGLNISLYLSASTPEPSTTASTSTTTSTVSTSTAPTPTTTDGVLHSLFAEFMANKNENAREYLKAVYENRLGGEADGLAAVQQQLRMSKRIRA